VFYVRFSGAGWLSLLIIFASLILGVCLGGMLFGGDGPGPAAGLVVAATLLATAPLHWRIGAALNSVQTPQGRVWHDRHTLYGAPMQRAAGAHVAFALIAVAIVVGATTSPLVGWAVVVLVPIAGAVVVGVRAERRRVRALADRKAVAEERGWRYRNNDATLAIRWRSRGRRRVPYAAQPFGILAGTLNGLPFTAFDTELGTLRYTNWAVHMPVAFPRLVVWGEAPKGSAPPLADLFDQFFPQHTDAAQRHMFAEVAQRPEVEADDPAFAAALATPEVRRATVAMDLRGWLIDGRDMILSRSYSKATPCRAAEVVGVADQLTALFYRFPIDAARRWASQPITGVPLEDATR
jgi:hypothetical protein